MKEREVSFEVFFSRLSPAWSGLVRGGEHKTTHFIIKMTQRGLAGRHMQEREREKKECI